MRTLVVTPTYNERDNLKVFVKEVLSVDEGIDMLIVDDNSPDGTGDIAERLSSVEPRIKVLHRPGKLGLGSAYIEGFQYALRHEYDCVVEMDADFSHRPVDLPKLIAAAETADVVIGSRNIPGGRVENWSLLRKIISRGGSGYTRLMLGVPVRDCTSGFKCFRREVLESIDFNGVESNGYGFQVEMNYLCHQAGFRIAEVPIVFPDREVGKSKMSRGIVFEAARRVWQLRRQPSTAMNREAPQAPAVAVSTALVTENGHSPVATEPVRQTRDRDDIIPREPALEPEYGTAPE
jgi:dolichol-phosphate mannosyltransferase